jgi:hypothetical protein
MIADTRLANDEGSGAALIRLNPAFRALMVVCGLVLAIFATSAMVFMSKGACPPAAMVLVFLICPFMLVGGVFCVWAAMRFAVIVSEDGVSYRSWRDWRFARWEEIRELKYQVTSFVLRTCGGRKLDVPIFITDLQQFLAACKQHLPREIIPRLALEKLENPSNMRWVWSAIQMIALFTGLGLGGTLGKGGPGLGRANGEELGRLLGFMAAMVTGPLTEAAVSRRWPALKSPPISQPIKNDVQRHGPARQAITSAVVWLAVCGVTLTGLAVTGSWRGGLAAPFLALFVLIAVAWVLTKIKNRRREAPCP